MAPRDSLQFSEAFLGFLIVCRGLGESKKIRDLVADPSRAHQTIAEIQSEMVD
jgi:hypothetical protein